MGFGEEDALFQRDDGGALQQVLECARAAPAGVGALDRLAELHLVADQDDVAGDRLTHHVHILEMNGESYRLAQSKSRRRAPTTPTHSS